MKKIFEYIKRSIHRFKIIRKNGNVSLSYWENRALKYGDRAVINLNLQESVEDITYKQISIYKPIVSKYLKYGDTCLDFGCGIGRFSGFLFEMTQQKIYGVDISNNLISIAKVNTIHNYIVYKHNTLPFEESYFDFIFINLVLGAISTEDLNAKIIPEINRVLKTGGYVFIAENTSNYQDVHYWNYRSKELYIDLFKSFEIIQADNYIEALEDISMFIMKKRG